MREILTLFSKMLMQTSKAGTILKRSAAETFYVDRVYFCINFVNVNKVHKQYFLFFF